MAESPGRPNKGTIHAERQDDNTHGENGGADEKPAGRDFKSSHHEEAIDKFLYHCLQRFLPKFAPWEAPMAAKQLSIPLFHCACVFLLQMRNQQAEISEALMLGKGVNVWVLCDISLGYQFRFLEQGNRRLCLLGRP